MKKIKVAEATPLQLDWLITSIEEPKACEYGVADWREQRNRTVKYGEYVYRWSSSWMQGGPIIEREKLGICHYNESDGWEVPNWAAWRTDIDDRQTVMGETALIAAMRCYVASKLGDVVDVPEELG